MACAIFNMHQTCGACAGVCWCNCTYQMAKTGILTYLEGLLTIYLLDPLVIWSCEITQTKMIISLLPQYLWPPNLGRMVTYLEGLLLIKLPTPLIMWSCKIFGITKTIIPPLPKCPWPPNLVGW